MSSYTTFHSGSLLTWDNPAWMGWRAAVAVRPSAHQQASHDRARVRPTWESWPWATRWRGRDQHLDCCKVTSSLNSLFLTTILKLLQQQRLLRSFSEHSSPPWVLNYDLSWSTNIRIWPKFSKRIFSMMNYTATTIRAHIYALSRHNICISPICYKILYYL
jgi:hypothetical protein